MTTDLAMGYELSNDLPAPVSKLIQITGRNEDHLKIWKQAFETGKWPDKPLGTRQITFFPANVRESEDAEEFVAAILEGLVQVYEDGINSYALFDSAVGTLLVCGPKIYLWDKQAWYQVNPNNPAWTSHEFICWMGKLNAIVLAGAPDMWFGDMAYWSDLLDTNLFSNQEAAESVRALLEETGPEDDEFYEIPIPDKQFEFFIANAWHALVYGPASPDPGSEFHKLRILAMVLSKEGYSVSVDWGEFVQTYDWVEVESADQGSVQVITFGAGDTSATADGKLPIVLLGPECDEAGIRRAIELGEEFGLEIHTLDTLGTGNSG